MQGGTGVGGGTGVVAPQSGGGADATKEGKNTSEKGDIKGLSDTKPQTPIPASGDNLGETKKMSDLSIEKQDAMNQLTTPGEEDRAESIVDGRRPSLPGDTEKPVKSDPEVTQTEEQRSEEPAASVETGTPSESGTTEKEDKSVAGDKPAERDTADSPPEEGQQQTA
ncbi:hypothetical protein [Endozoicomonas sp.]|uniref:hypothetical protein n=1 Tax=Endozoicomonas sp. TaxID=1892382 RepID=UPI00383BE80D